MYAQVSTELQFQRIFIIRLVYFRVVICNSRKAGVRLNSKKLKIFWNQLSKWLKIENLEI